MASSESRAPPPRHHWPDRAFHWSMALAVLVLLVSAFLPVAGIKFDWIPWHWISGVALTVLLLLHVLRATFVQGLSNMLPNGHDVRRLLRRAAASDSEESEAQKYDVFQKGYHWVTTLVVGTLVATGLPMLIKLDTLLWDRNPGVLTDLQWGYIYVAHGVASLLLIFFVIMHLYFALLPEHKSLLMAMIRGGSATHAIGGESD